MTCGRYLKGPDMQSNDTCHSVTAPFPPSVHLFRGCSVTIMSWLWIKWAGNCRHCWRPDCCCAQLCTVHFVPLTAAALHCGILLYAVGFDSKYCMLWGGQELPGVQLLGSMSWPFLSPASALALRLGWCTALAGALWQEQVCEQPGAQSTV